MTEYHYDRGSSSPTRSDEKTVGFERRGSEIVLSAEDAELAKLGYKQEFKREFSWISTFSFAFSISGLLATVIPLNNTLSDFVLGGNHVRVSLECRWKSSCCLVLVNSETAQRLTRQAYWGRVLHVYCHECRRIGVCISCNLTPRHH